MGFVAVLGACMACKQVFSFNPNRVPSLRINGVREPVCRACVERANAKRGPNGLPPIEILPGAYEAEPEDEVRWS